MLMSRAEQIQGFTRGPWHVAGTVEAFGVPGRCISSEHGRIAVAVFRPSLRGDEYRDANARDELRAEVEKLRAQVREMEEAPLNQLRKQRDELADALKATCEGLLIALSFDKVRDEDFDQVPALHAIADGAEQILHRLGRLA
jgi:hypothetical protein